MFAVMVRAAHGDDSGVLGDLLPSKGIGSGLKREPPFHAISLRTVKLLWTREFGDHVALRPATGREFDDKGDWHDQRAFDLGLYREPFFSGEQVCVTFAGIRCYSSWTGKPVWSSDFPVNDGDLALSYSTALAAEDTIYMSSDGRMRALNATNGRPRGVTRIGAAIPEVQEAEDKLFLQLGGRFFDANSESWKWCGEYGVAAVDRKSGRELWRFDDADDSTSNVLLFAGRA